MYLSNGIPKEGYAVKAFEFTISLDLRYILMVSFIEVVNNALIFLNLQPNLDFFVNKFGSFVTNKISEGISTYLRATIAYLQIITQRKRT